MIEIITCMGTAHNGNLKCSGLADIGNGPYIIQLIQKIVGSWTKYIAIEILPKNYTMKKNHTFINIAVLKIWKY